ncbi:serine/threonine protein kinase [Sediminispirochaeta smaragdinae]|uniref:Serine/threonine protein kinase n=1 Tax=Sediminispirochaeta smaragdinae (strain DSM 11293 / JCM 15392 / SEBR 4228) TaxID=573413 RepID=E1RCC3_SEDSS|nr:serine/threonine-protein kinase [Sediminispirochaeta smaragdinae]ADK80003.1 serine/threonine protein kinase [Sediminispirochaeta smaragdinae DSM 11293]
MDLEGVTINNCYLIRSKISDDGLVEFWNAHAVYSANTFTICFIRRKRSEFPARVLEDLRTLFFRLYEVKDRNIETLIELGFYDEYPFISILRNSGIPLTDKLNSGWKLPFKDALPLFSDIVDSLYYLETTGLHHGFVSFETISIDPVSVLHTQLNDSYVQGLLPFYDENNIPDWIQKRSLFLYNYRNKLSNIDLHRDIYSLGMTLYSLLFGISAFQVRDGYYFPSKDVIKHSSLSGNARKIIERMLFSPKKFSSIKELREMISSLFYERNALELLEKSKYQKKQLSINKKGYARAIRGQNNTISLWKLWDTVAGFFRNLFVRSHSPREKSVDSQDTAELLEIDENVEKDGENVSWQINRTFDDYFLGYRKLSKSNYSMPIQNSEGSEKKDGMEEEAYTEPIRGPIYHTDTTKTSENRTNKDETDSSLSTSRKQDRIKNLRVTAKPFKLVAPITGTKKIPFPGPHAQTIDYSVSEVLQADFEKDKQISDEHENSPQMTRHGCWYRFLHWIRSLADRS